MGQRSIWLVALLLLSALVVPHASATTVDLRRTICTAALPDTATEADIARAPYRCGDAAPSDTDGWLWLRLDPAPLAALPSDWTLLIDQARFRRIAVLTDGPAGLHRITREAGALRDHRAPGGLLKFNPGVAGRDIRGLYIGFDHIDDLTFMRKITAASPAAAAAQDTRWLLLMGAFAGVMLSALLYNVVIHAGRRYAFQRWYLLWVSVAFAYGMAWTNMAAFVLPDLVGPAAVRLDFILVGVMVAAGNMFFFAVLEPGMVPRPLIWAGRLLAAAGAVSGVAAAADTIFPAVLADRLLNYAIAGTAVTVGLACAIAVRRRSRVIWFYMAGWGPVIVVFLARLARNLGFMPQNDVVDMATFAALGIEALVLSLAIADRFRLLRQKLDHARQRRAVDQAESKALRLAAQTDFLTGLGNRAAFQQEARRMIAARSPFALFLIDVDYLKDANDRMGHAGGDALLRHVGTRLAAIADRHAGAQVARIGGDEFALLCPGDAPIETAVATAIGEMQGERLVWTKQARDVSCSVGSARFPDDADTADILYQNADLALYNAKRFGRGRHYRYDPLQRMLKDLQNELADDAEAALLRGEFRLFLQPIVTLATGEICGHEALLRWKHPDHGLLTPDRFADVLVAEKIGLKIQEHVLDLALARLRDDGDRIGQISVNFTAAQLTGPRAASRVLDRLSHHGVSPTALCVELTEGVMLDRSADTILATLQTLHDAGVSIALDDFGTGYASLVHLRQMPVDRIKIDRSFVAGLDQADGGTLAIVRAILGLGRGLGKLVVAEGIETEAQAHHLRQLGCQLGQGFHYGRPAPEPHARPLATATRLPVKSHDHPPLRLVAAAV